MKNILQEKRILIQFVLIFFIIIKKTQSSISEHIVSTEMMPVYHNLTNPVVSDYTNNNIGDKLIEQESSYVFNINRHDNVFLSVMPEQSDGFSFINSGNNDQSFISEFT